MSERPEILVITGPPGAGKTSVSEALVARTERSVLVDGDAFFGFVRRGRVPPWEPAADRQNCAVIRAVGAAAEQFAVAGFFTVVDGVIGPWFLEAFLEHVTHPVGYVILRPSAEVAMKRAVARDMPALVDPVPISDMFNAFSALDDHERFVIYSTLMDTQETTDAIVRLILKGEFLAR
jgi:cytidylate kinase